MKKIRFVKKLDVSCEPYFYFLIKIVCIIFNCQLLLTFLYPLYIIVRSNKYVEVWLSLVERCVRVTIPNGSGRTYQIAQPPYKQPLYRWHSI